MVKLLDKKIMTILRSSVLLSVSGNPTQGLIGGSCKKFCHEWQFPLLKNSLKATISADSRIPCCLHQV